MFSNKNLLIIYGDEATPDYIEVKALPRNYAHLTGVKLNENIPNNTPETFLDKVLSHKLNENDFDFKKDGSTEQKLRVLFQTLSIKYNSKMIGDFSGNRVNLKTSKVAGSVSSFLGFKKVNNYYIPNTVIEGDIRKDTYYRSRILGVLSKKIEDQYYNEKIYIAKNVDADKLLQALKKEVFISQELKPLNYSSTVPSSNTESFSLAPPLSTGNVAVLPAPRPPFGQAVREFLKDICEQGQGNSQAPVSQIRSRYSGNGRH